MLHNNLSIRKALPTCMRLLTVSRGKMEAQYDTPATPPQRREDARPGFSRASSLWPLCWPPFSLLIRAWLPSFPRKKKKQPKTSRSTVGP